MVTIMTDSSAMMKIAEGASENIIVNPLSVTIGGNTYLDLEEIDNERFLALIAEGHLPISSQPSVGQTLALYEEHAHGPLLNITMADGLSGTYQTAQGAVACMTEEQQKNIRVINSTTLWGNEGYLVHKARKLADEGLDIDGILDGIAGSIAKNKSFLIPSDFDFLKRGGRLSPLAANVGGLLKLVPIMTQTPDGRRLDKSGLCRNMKGVFQNVGKGLVEFGLNKDFLLSISHSGSPKVADDALAYFSNMFPDVEMRICPLSPAMTTQGGPRCIAVQAILK